jgi:hypothetical protein
MLFVLSVFILLSAARCYSIQIWNNNCSILSVKFKEYTSMFFLKPLHSSTAFSTKKNVSCVQRKTADKYDKDTNKSSCHS